MTTTAASPASWSELLGPRYRSTSVVLAGGVGLHAVNIFLTTSLLPTAIGELGRESLYAWSATVFMVASVISSMTVSRLLAHRGALGAYLFALAPFFVGTMICAVGPTMEVLLVGRAIQGLGGGLLAGLSYAVLREALPEQLWARATALVSAMWGVGTLAGPAIGGLFAQLGLWRLAFVALAVVAAAIALIAPRALPRTERVRGGEPVPAMSLALLTLATIAISVAGILGNRTQMLVLIALGVVFIALFVAWERRSHHRVLPQSTYTRASSLKWIYLTIAVLASGTVSEAFTPLFGQRLAGLVPFAAGFLGAMMSVGWSVTMIFSSDISRPRAQTAAKVAGPVVLAAGLLVTAGLWRDDAGLGTVILWAGALAAAGAGIGLAFPHLMVAAMRSSDDEQEGAKAAAGLNTVELIAMAVGSAIAGVLVNLGAPSILTSARLLFLGLGVIATVGVYTAYRATRHAAATSPASPRTVA
ncbi:MFS transporter [Rhodococcus jostii]|uniref:Major Facilitator Superfamily protein n=1 Tax=Rhodococcus jostii TaxID=132919 RepID=A0A1H5MD95_RHOJO|nr:MFS transporter [Rhodococcus jostii]SEE87265.1 Major Facilitator Superfamily protein [Rhodococcus jostii]